jgi:hypothetical protein
LPGGQLLCAGGAIKQCGGEREVEVEVEVANICLLKSAIHNRHATYIQNIHITS